MRRYTLALLVTFLAFVNAPLSFAHGEIVSAFPEQYSNVAPIPTQAWIQFGGNLQEFEGETINTIDVVDSTNLIVSFGDPVIEGGKISTKISGQSVAGIFTVNYRIVSEDGHPVEGSYTFSASPDYAQSEIATTSEPQPKSQLSVGAMVLGLFLLVFLIGALLKIKREKR